MGAGGGGAVGKKLTAIIPARKYGNLQWIVARKNSNEL